MKYNKKKPPITCPGTGREHREERGRKKYFEKDEKWA
jgi:hypothetical protein